MIAEVRLWGRTIGAVSLDEGQDVAAFQYDPTFAASGIELSPLVMPLSDRVYEFPTLPRNTFLTIRQLKLPMAAAEEQFRRMAFNLVAHNQDDPVKNIAFVMDKQGQWSLAPAFDVTYSYNPSGTWTAMHQMTLNGKRDNFSLQDFEACAKAALMKRGRAAKILGEVCVAVKSWPEFADEAGVSHDWQVKIQNSHRLTFPK